jgi:hypothetical protein
MAKKAAESTGSTSKTTKKSTTTTKVRNSPIPKAPPAPSRTSATAISTETPTFATRRVTHEEIARKAYEIWKSGRGGTAFENWIRAERELRAQATQSN